LLIGPSEKNTHNPSWSQPKNNKTLRTAHRRFVAARRLNAAPAEKNQQPRGNVAAPTNAPHMPHGQSV